CIYNVDLQRCRTWHGNRRRVKPRTHNGRLTSSERPCMMHLQRCRNRRQRGHRMSRHAQTPPMGWNSWDSYGTTVTQEEVLANAAVLAERLLPHGWDTV